MQFPVITETLSLSLNGAAGVPAAETAIDAVQSAVKFVAPVNPTFACPPAPLVAVPRASVPQGGPPVTVNVTPATAVAAPPGGQKGEIRDCILIVEAPPSGMSAGRA